VVRAAAACRVEVSGAAGARALERHPRDEDVCSTCSSSSISDQRRRWAARPAGDTPVHDHGGRHHPSAPANSQALMHWYVPKRRLELEQCVVVWRNSTVLVLGSVEDLVAQVHALGAGRPSLAEVASIVRRLQSMHDQGRGTASWGCSILLEAWT
jgi:hypothetical protein